MEWPIDACMPEMDKAEVVFAEDFRFCDGVT